MLLIILARKQLTASLPCPIILSSLTMTKDSVVGDSMERYPERCFHIIVPGQPKFDSNTSSISPLYETSYKNMLFYKLKSCPCHNDVSF